MTTVFTILLASLVALGVVVWIAIEQYWHRLADNAPDLSTVDIEGFLQLVDPKNEEFLESRVSSKDLRAFRRARAKAAIEYLAVVARYSGHAVRALQVAAESADVEKGAGALDVAIRLRSESQLAILRFYLQVLFPSLALKPAESFSKYTNIVREIRVLNSSPIMNKLDRGVAF